jgi:hypothetical protein
MNLKLSPFDSKCSMIQTVLYPALCQVTIDLAGFFISELSVLLVECLPVSVKQILNKVAKATLLFVRKALRTL